MESETKGHTPHTFLSQEKRLYSTWGMWTRSSHKNFFSPQGALPFIAHHRRASVISFTGHRNLDPRIPCTGHF